MIYENELMKILQKARAEAKAEGKMEIARLMLEAGICFEEIYMFTGIAEEDIIKEMESGLADKIERDHAREIEKELKINIGLETRLKEWRYKHYKTLNIPSYMVMPNKTLMEIASRIPRNREELMAIKGFGNARWEKYGQEILAITADF
jgi:superfamily II DNA helicase RecQ